METAGWDWRGVAVLTCNFSFPFGHLCDILEFITWLTQTRNSQNKNQWNRMWCSMIQGTNDSTLQKFIKSRQWATSERITVGGWGRESAFAMTPLLHKLLHGAQTCWEANGSSANLQFPVVYGTGRFIVVFTEASHWLLLWGRLIQSVPRYHISSRRTLMLGLSSPFTFRSPNWSPFRFPY
jgi:hypothetical protein